jgi:hypothetical protein
VTFSSNRLGEPLTPGEVATIEAVARAEVREAFTGCASPLSGRHDALYTLHVMQDVLDLRFKRAVGVAGQSRGITGFGGSGSVSFDFLANGAMAWAPDDASREELVTAIGRGIGRTAVHEFTHQILPTGRFTPARTLQLRVRVRGTLGSVHRTDALGSRTAAARTTARFEYALGSENREVTMRRTILAVLAACGLSSVFVGAQAPTPFKLGTFQRQGITFVGVVIRDTQVINLQVANAAVSTGKRITAPTDMKDLIARYDNGVRQRIVEIVAAVVAATTRPAYVMDLASLKVMPPIMYPLTMMNVAVNYREHAVEMAARGARPGRPAGGERSGHGAAGHDERRRDLGARQRRPALEPLCIPQGARRRSSRRASRS